MRMRCIGIDSIAVGYEASCMTDTGLAVVNLRTNYLVHPIGIGDRWPRCSWEVVSHRRDVTQRAFRIIAGSSSEHMTRGQGDCWDPGWVMSGDTNQIPHAGRLVRARERIWWTVRTEDSGGTARCGASRCPGKPAGCPIPT